MKLNKTLRKKLKSYKPKKLSAPVIIIAFGLIGLVALVTSRAAIPTASIEAENGSKTGNACILGTPGTSSNNVVSFGNGNCSQSESTIPGLSRIPWEGGPNYWKASNGAQFANADASGWDDPSFFPITVFYGKAETRHVNLLKEAGINTYAPVEYSPDIHPITNITNAGMFAMPGGEWSQASVGNNQKVVGWFISDECDMGYSGCDNGTEGETARQFALSQQTKWVNERRAQNDGRFVHANFGNGILQTYWAVNGYMAKHIALLDSSSADKYTYTSPDVQGIIDGWHDAPDWPNGVPVARAYSYGWQVDQMKRFQPANRPTPIWAFIETSKPYLTESGARDIKGEEIEGAVWSSIIHEARGVSYFQHNTSNSNCSANYSIVDCPNVHAAVKKVNDKVKSLAPIINTQSYYNKTETINGHTYYKYDFNNNTDTMLKAYNGSAYIFAGLGMDYSSRTADATGSKTFTLPSSIKGTSVEVVGENRTIPVVNGQFSDTFPQEYSHHVYRINL